MNDNYTPAPADEPRTLTWRSDDTGCTWEELEDECRVGRRAEIVRLDDEVTVITVWLPEVPEVPEWAQDCNTQSFDLRAVATDDRRLWRPYIVRHRGIQEWRGTDGDDTKTTDELAAMGARLLIDRDGKAVL